jgi:WD40 repeat protein
MRILALDRRIFHGVAFSSDGRHLITLNSKKLVRVWDRATWEARVVFDLERWNDPWGSSMLTWGSTFALTGDLLPYRNGVWDFGPALEDARDPNRESRPAPLGFLCRRIDLDLPTFNSVTGIACDGRTIVGVTHRGGEGHRVRVWDLGGRQRSEFSPNQPIQHWGGVALSPGGRTLAAPSPDRSVVLIDLTAKEAVGRLPHTDSVSNIVFAPDGQSLASTAGRSIWQWDVVERKPIRRFPAFGKFASAPAFHPGGELLGAGSRDGQVRLWKVIDGTEVGRFDWGVGAINGLAFSPDGLTAAVAGQRGKVVVWDLE